MLKETEGKNETLTDGCVSGLSTGEEKKGRKRTWTLQDFVAQKVETGHFSELRHR